MVLSEDERAIFERIATALEKLAGIETCRKHKAPTLGTAAYSEEERERLRLRENLTRQAQKQAQ